MATVLKEVMAYLLKHHPEDMSNTRLNNVVFLCDWRHAEKYGFQITSIQWYLSKFPNSGAYVRDIETTAENHKDVFSITHGPEGIRLFSLKDDDYQPSIGGDARETLGFVIRETKELSSDEFLKMVNETPPVATSSQSQQPLNLVELAKKRNKRKP